MTQDITIGKQDKQQPTTATCCHVTNIGQHTVFDIIESNSDKEIISEIGSFFKDFMQPITDIQVGKLVLNNIDHPTDYAKVKQIKSELVARYNNIIETYYTIKKKELEIELLNEEIENEPHPIKKKLKALDNEKAVLQLMGEKSRLDVILSEIRTYYKYYNKYNNGFNNITEEQKAILEEELWAKKALNNPVVFEERYGGFIKDILGERRYNEYLERRRSTMGILPRELIP
jgi:hypothetical protein